MGEATKIEWADHTFNPWIGCAKVAAGCKECYAENNRFVVIQRSQQKELWGKNAERHVTSDANWKKPLQWARQARRANDWHEDTVQPGGRPVRPRVFCGSLCDVFEDRHDLVAPRARLFSLITQAPELDWLLLTKRPENVAALWGIAINDNHDDPLPRNVWIGTSIAEQKDADKNIPTLLKIPADVRFVSYEPAVGPVDFGSFFESEPDGDPRVPGDATRVVHSIPGLDWVIVGGESGKNARPCDVAWIRSAVQQCQAAGVPVFVKQLGTAVHGGGLLSLTSGRCFKHPKAGDWSEWPEDLRVREFPGVKA